MNPGNRFPSPRQESPAKTAARQKLEKIWRTQSRLQWPTSIAGILWIGQIALGHRGTLFLVTTYAVIALALLALTSMFRWALYEKRSRVAREICCTCKYNLAGLDMPDRCPECGTMIDRPPGSNVR